MQGEMTGTLSSVPQGGGLGPGKLWPKISVASGRSSTVNLLFSQRGQADI